jgi:pimeloyl-ACP methyl ester carboxylesterase
MCQWHPRDIDDIGEVVDRLAAHTGIRPGLVGFSHGASYALVLASRASHAERVRFVLSFGAFHDLNTLLGDYAHRQPPARNDQTALDDWIYLHLVLARGLGERAGLRPDAERQLAPLLERYCHEATPAEKLAFFEQHAAHRDLVALALAGRDAAALQAVSPAGKLAAVRCPVGVIHDARDTMIPAEHARRVHEELCACGDRGAKHTLQVTRLLSHVTLRDTMRLGEAARLLAALRPVVLTGGGHSKFLP